MHEFLKRSVSSYGMIDVQIKALDKIAQQVVAKVAYMNQNQ
jgi:dUTPase